MPPQKSAANLGDIALALGVSIATVSNALSGKGRVSAGLATRIQALATDLGYVPSQAGRALRTGRTGVIGLVLADIANPLFPQFAQAIEGAASARGYGVLIADSRGDVAMQTAAIGRLIDRGVDGIVIVPRHGTRIADLGCPVAVIDSPSTPGNTVSADHWQGGEAIGQHLTALGHRHVVLIGNNPASNVQNDRIGGIRAGLGAGVQVEVLWIERHERVAGTGAPLGLAQRVAAGATAFATVSDLHALRALTELHRAGVVVPEQVTVTGFDDLVWASAVTPALTTVRMDMPRIAETAIEALIQAIERDVPNDRAGTLTACNARIPMQLIARQTSGPAPHPFPIPDTGE